MIHKLKIGLVHYTYPPVVGGVERIIFEHAQLFAKYDFSTKVFTGEGSNSNSKISLTIIPEFRSLALWNLALKEKLLSEPVFPPDVYQIKETILSKLESAFADIDIFIVHNVLTNILNIPLNLALKEYIESHPNKKFIAWTHDIALDSKKERINFLNPQMDKLIYSPLQNVHYVGISNFLKDTLTKKIGFKKDNIFIIPNGIDIASFLDLSPITQEFFSRNKLLESELLILLPSKIMKNKNVHICIEVISQLKKKIPSVKLVITGKNFPHGKYLDYLKNTYSQIKNLDLENNVVLLSDVFTETKNDATFDLVKSLYRLSDLVFFFSSYENFGLPLIEAGITKTPIICNNLKVFKEIENMNLYFVDIKKDTSSDMANKVLDILDHNRQVAYFRKIKINYSFETIFLKKIIPLIDKL